LEDQDKHAKDSAFLESQRAALAAIEKNPDKRGATKAAPAANPGSSDKAGPSGGQRSAKSSSKAKDPVPTTKDGTKAKGTPAPIASGSATATK